MKKLLIGLAAVIFAICVLALLIVQLALTMPAGRELILESGLIVRANAYPVGTNLGEIVLSISGARPSENIKILQNGVVVASFVQPTIIVAVDDNSLIEVDGRQTAEEFTVKIEVSAQNVKFYGDKKQTQIRRNIAVLARVFLEDAGR